MVVARNPIFQWMEGVHNIWNARRVMLYDLKNGRVGVAVVWTDDGPDNGRERYPSFLDVFSFNVRDTSKWEFQSSLWQRLENRRKRLWPSRG
jgi:hypothetical protein